MNQGFTGFSMPGGSNVLAETTLTGPAPSLLVPLPTASPRYRDLRLSMLARGDTAAASVILRVQFNGDTGGNYDTKVATAGSAASVGQTTTYGDPSGSLQAITAATAPANAFAAVDLELPDFTNTSRLKVLLGRTVAKISTSGDGNFVLYHYGIYWTSTAAITSVLLFPASGNFAAGTYLRVSAA